MASPTHSCATTFSYCDSCSECESDCDARSVNSHDLYPEYLSMSRTLKANHINVHDFDRGEIPADIKALSIPLQQVDEVEPRLSGKRLPLADLLAITDTWPDGAEWREAFERRDTLIGAAIARCHRESDGAWLRTVSKPIFNTVFQSAWTERRISWTSGSRWMKEQDLLSLNPAFPLPKSAPTEALGVGLSEETWPGDDRMPDPMSGLAVRELEHSLGPGVGTRQVFSCGISSTDIRRGDRSCDQCPHGTASCCLGC